MHLQNLPAITPLPCGNLFKTILRSEVQKLFRKADVREAPGREARRTNRQQHHNCWGANTG